MNITNLYETIISVSNNILVSFYILFVGLLFASLFEKFSRFALGELRVNDLVRKGLKFNIDIRYIVSKIIYYFFFIGTIILSLNNLGLAWYVVITWLIFIGIIFALSLILDVKDGLKNIYYGYISVNRIKKDNIIKTDIIKGKVLKKSIFGITIDYKGEKHYLPNIFLSKGYIIEK